MPKGVRLPIVVGTKVTHGDDRYTIDAMLKSGGFGTTFIASRIVDLLGKPVPIGKVVVKVPRDDVLQDPIWATKFEREARILANVSHTNIVKSIAFWEFANGEKALVQEYIAGSTEVHDYIRQKHEAVPSLYLQGLYALNALQNSSRPAVVHRDISPANILVDGEGVLKLIDFGLAKEDPRATKILTVAGQGFGTPGCMAPEQFLDAASVDHRADQYGLGRTFTGGLQGRHPQHADPNALPEPWRSLCGRLTQHDADHRYSSAAEAVIDALDCFAAHGLALLNMELHVDEMRMFGGASPPWAAVCQNHFMKLPDLDVSDIRVAAGLTPSIYQVGFDANTFFDRLEASRGIAAYASGVLSYDAADHLGELYNGLYDHLNASRRQACFLRLVDTALRYHRYSVMGRVRNVYERELDSALRAGLLTILNREDTGNVIEGRGIIPGR